MTNKQELQNLGVFIIQRLQRIKLEDINPQLNMNFHANNPLVFSITVFDKKIEDNVTLHINDIRESTVKCQRICAKALNAIRTDDFEVVKKIFKDIS